MILILWVRENELRKLNLSEIIQSIIIRASMLRPPLFLLFLLHCTAVLAMGILLVLSLIYTLQHFLGHQCSVLMQ